MLDLSVVVPALSTCAALISCIKSKHLPFLFIKLSSN